MSKGTLIAFGCSNTAGTESIHDFDEGPQDLNDNYNHAYPKFLADALEYDYINHSYSGASNQEIASCVFNFIGSETFSQIYNPFILIGWTCDKRLSVLVKSTIQNSENLYENIYSTFTNVNNLIPTTKNPCRTLSMASVNSSLKVLLNRKITPLDQLHMDNLRPLTPEFVVDLNQKVFNSPGFNEINFFIKYAAISVLEQKQIPYLTLPTIWFDYNRKYFLLNEKRNLLPFTDKKEVDFLPLKKFEKYGLSKIKAHLKELAHKELAKYLYSHILTNNLL